MARPKIVKGELYFLFNFTLNYVLFKKSLKLHVMAQNPDPSETERIFYRIQMACVNNRIFCRSQSKLIRTCFLNISFF